MQSAILIPIGRAFPISVGVVWIDSYGAADTAGAIDSREGRLSHGVGYLKRTGVPTAPEVDSCLLPAPLAVHKCRVTFSVQTGTSVHGGFYVIEPPPLRLCPAPVVLVRAVFFQAVSREDQAVTAEAVCNRVAIDSVRDLWKE